MTLREIWGRLTAWTRRGGLDAQVARELEEHLALLARDLESEGMPPAEARWEARRRLGNLTALRETTRSAWGFPALDAVLRDVRYAARGLIRSPGFTATVALTLGLGIGANAAMFAVIDRLMFRPFPYLEAPGRVHGVYLQSMSRGKLRTYATFQYTRYLDLSASMHSFDAVAAVSQWRLAVGTGAETQVRKVAGVSASFWRFFTAPPAQGRYFGPEEDRTPRGATVAVLGWSYWMSEFGGKDVAGKVLRVGGLDYTVIGVAPREFVGVAQGRNPELFVPVTTIPATMSSGNADTYYSAYNWDWVEMMVRRRPGVSRDAADADLTAAWIRSRAKQRAINPVLLPDSVARPRAVAGALKSAAGPDRGLESRVLLWVMGVAGIVLLIAGANVANLLVARAYRRGREIALRLALGISRTRLAMQFALEALLLAAMGGVTGLIAAQFAGLAIRSMLLPEGSTFNLSTDWRTIGVVAGCALIITGLIAIGPAFLAIRSDVGGSLKAGAREGTPRRSRLRVGLLIAQGALSVVLLVGAGLFVKSLRNILAIPLGYDPSTVLEVYPDFRGAVFDSATGVAVRRRLLEEAQRIPGVEAAARVNSSLFGTNTTGLQVPGVDSADLARLGRFNMQMTTPGFFKVMRTGILRGRGLEESDREGATPVVVVSSAMANALWPGKDPLGRCIQVRWAEAARIPVAPCITVVGVAEDAANQGLLDDQRFMYYMSLDQVRPDWVSRIYVRMQEGDLDRDLERVRRAMQAVMPGDGFVFVRTLQSSVDDQRRSWRLGATLFTAFGGLALVVAAVGLYGVIAYSVSQRMHELGVRIALGARSVHIVRLVASQGLAYAGAGAAIGLVLAAVLSHWVAPLLYKASPRDPATYGTVGGVMVVLGLIAGLIPAMRAVRADPNQALRVD